MTISKFMENYSVNVVQGIKIGTSVSADKITGFYLDYSGLLTIFILIIFGLCIALIKHFLILYLKEKFPKKKGIILLIISLIAILLLVILFLLGINLFKVYL